MRLDGIEIKVTIGADQVAAARDEWLPDGEGDRRAIWFLEQRPAAAGPVTLPLLDAGVILRLRQNQDDEDDSTVKLRPCERSRLSDRWLEAEKGDGWKFTVEQDWVGDRHVLAASLVAEQGEGEIAALRDHTRPARALFSSEQCPSGSTARTRPRRYGRNGTSSGASASGASTWRRGRPRPAPCSSTWRAGSRSTPWSPARPPASAGWSRSRSAGPATSR